MLPGLRDKLSVSWRVVYRSLPLAALSLTLWSAQASADIVRITSVNGNYDPDHSDQVTVHPGDVVSLSADAFSDDGSGSYQPKNQDVENFVWQSNAETNDICDASANQQCLDQSNFEVTDYGVNFYVPYQAGAQIQINVVDRSNQQSDVITLTNVAASDPTYVPPTTVVTTPDQYNSGSLNPDTALAGQGRWVYINGTRYFVPYTVQDSWQPYQNGYWNNTDDGLTWVSYDPWGWYTDHYGVWRSHGVYGWIWLPFATPTYRPHTVTFYYGDDYIGWYPYYDGYRDGYYQGYNDGFRDGYWDGYFAGSVSNSYSWYRPGYTVVRYGSFGAVNIYDIRVTDYTIINNYWGNSYGRGYYGQYPGGYDNYSSQVWLNGRLVSPLGYSRVVNRPCGGYDLHYPIRSNPLPSYYNNVNYGSDRFQRPYPVGSSIRPPVQLNGRPVVIPPAQGGRGVTMPPRYMDPNQGQYVPMPPRTQRPATQNPGNPNYSPNPNNRPGTPVNNGPGNGGFPGNNGPGNGNGNPSGPVNRPQPPVYRPGPGTNIPGNGGRQGPTNPGNGNGNGPGPQPTFQPRPQPTFNPNPGNGGGGNPGGRTDPNPGNGNGNNGPRPQPTFNPNPGNGNGPGPQPTFQPRPQPTFNPNPGNGNGPGSNNPQPQPTFQPRPQPTFNPNPGNGGGGNPGGRTEPQPQPTQQPRPQPTYNPQPQPTQQPRPQPTYQPQPQPRPQPTYNPQPQPQPQPRPQPTYNPNPGNGGGGNPGGRTTPPPSNGGGGGGGGGSRPNPPSPPSGGGGGPRPGGPRPHAV